MYITGSLENTTAIIEKLVCVEKAENGTFMKATHLFFEDILIEEQIRGRGFANSAGALREVRQPRPAEREGSEGMQ